MTSFFEIIVIFFLVFFIATISSSLGIGGGIFTVPLLLYLGKYHLIHRDVIGHIAIANSLLVAFILSISATYINIKLNQINLNLGLAFLVGSLPGSFFGVYISKYLKTKELTLLFGFIVFIIGLSSFIRAIKNKNQDKTQDIVNQRQKNFHLTKKYLIILIPIGFFTGVISSLTGIGGGVIMVPLFSFILKNESFQVSIGTSTFCMSIITFISSFLYLFENPIYGIEPSIGYYYLPFTIPMVLGSIPGGFTGAKLKGKLPAKNLQIFLSILQMFIGLKVLFW